MPKKKSTTDSPRPNPRAMGLAAMNTKEILALIEDCRRELAEIESHVARASEASVDSIPMNGATQLSRGLELLQQFSGHLYKGIKALGSPRRT